MDPRTAAREQTRCARRPLAACLPLLPAGWRHPLWQHGHLLNSSTSSLRLCTRPALSISEGVPPAKDSDLREASVGDDEGLEARRRTAWKCVTASPAAAGGSCLPPRSGARTAFNHSAGAWLGYDNALTAAGLGFGEGRVLHAGLRAPRPASRDLSAVWPTW